jgi:uncharacterized protein YegP (UPF0339 family)
VSSVSARLTARRTGATDRPCSSMTHRYSLHLNAANGEIIAASQAYETKASAEKSIESVKANAPTRRS